MVRRKSRTLTEVELEIMKVLWSNGEVTVDQVREALNAVSRPLALPSIRTMLSILHEKGYVTRRRDGRAHVYRAVIDAKQAERTILQDVVDRVYDGSAASFVAALLSQGVVSKNDLAKARELIAQHRGDKRNDSPARAANP
jgi:predicted transcriptional regulator